jgi:hypothetical protein
MEHLLELYRNPPAELFFFDECPGIQVLMRLVPDLQTDTMKQRLEDFERVHFPLYSDQSLEKTAG